MGLFATCFHFAHGTGTRTTHLLKWNLGPKKAAHSHYRDMVVNADYDSVVFYTCAGAACTLSNGNDVKTEDFKLSTSKFEELLPCRSKEEPLNLHGKVERRGRPEKLVEATFKGWRTNIRW